MSNVAEMPKWDLTAFFPSLKSPEYTEAVSEIDQMLGNAESFWNDSNLSDPAQARTDAATLRVAINTLNDLQNRLRIVGGYSSLLVSADSSDEEAQAAVSALSPFTIRLSKLNTIFTAWVGTLDLEKLAEQDEVVKDHEFALSKVKIQSQHLMSPVEEALAADLSEFGPTAWSKLYFNFQSNIEVVVNGESMPMSACRALAYDQDAATREAAFHAELDAWKANEIPCAAAMNNIKGVFNLLSDRRGWSGQLEQTLFACNMDQESLEAMMDAAEDSFPDWRRYLRAKAKAIGKTGGLPFHDLFASVGTERNWTWKDAEDFVEEGFRSFTDKLGDFARRTFDEKWHDAGPRKGKRDGAFCSGVRGDESRMLHNFKSSFGGVSTLAHELGHAYHNVCLSGRTPMQKQTPMTLAETASIFCETIIKRTANAHATGDEKLALLDASLVGGCQVTVDISSRFKFESSVISGRREREMSAAEMCEAMLDAQKQTYGDGLSVYHPYMWAAKPHYYGYMAFYNFPYMFGLLFALGLYNIYENEPEGFEDRYDQLLSSTGMHMAADLTQTFGINIRSKEFWAGSLAVLKQDIDEFEKLVG